MAPITVSFVSLEYDKRSMQKHTNFQVIDHLIFCFDVHNFWVNFVENSQLSLSVNNHRIHKDNVKVQITLYERHSANF